MSTLRRNNLTGPRRGAMLLFVAITMVGMLGLLTLTLDLSAGGRQRRIAQAAADAAALAGAFEIKRGMDSASIVNAAYATADSNKYAGSSVVVYRRPQTGPHAGDPKFVEVRITKTETTIFGSFFNKNSMPIAARAVAGTASFSTLCVFGLSGSGTAIDIPGDLDASNCSVYSNSSIDVGKLWASSIGAVGTVQGDRAGTVTTGVPPAPDPFAYLQLPSTTTCNYNNTILTSNQTLNPGVYCGGINLNGRVATLNPGTYFIRGGGIDGSSNNSGMIGDSVTIINSIGNGVGGLAAFRPIVFGNSCSVRLSASTSGPYKGILMYADPAAPSSGPYSVNELCGMGANGSNTDLRGTIYFPTQTFKLTNSNGKLVVAGTIVASVVTGQNGGGKFTMKMDDTGNSGVLRVSLVE